MGFAAEFPQVAVLRVLTSWQLDAVATTGTVLKCIIVSNIAVCHKSGTYPMEDVNLHLSELYFFLGLPIFFICFRGVNLSIFL